MENFKKILLIILDGFGISKEHTGNAVLQANPVFINGLFSGYPFTTLAAHGLDVGLPEGTMGNSEVGHSNIGAGRVIMQDLTKIDLAIKNNELRKNAALLEFIEKAKQNGSRVHLMGLLSESGVHSELSHLLYLIDLFFAAGIEKIFIHPFLDGRDSPPRSAPVFLEKLLGHIKPMSGRVWVSTVCGRFYAMDRDTRWERVEKAFNLLTRLDGERFDDPYKAVEKFYASDITDEFIPPAVIGNKPESGGSIKSDDGVLFFNFRADRAKQLTEAFTSDRFDMFRRDGFKPVQNFLSMTKYDDSFKNPFIISPENYANILGEVISGAGLKQLRIAETEKYAHVTYFFNCGREEPFAGEDRVLIPSPRDCKTYDEKPEMSAFKIKDALMEKLKTGKYGFIACNFANGDMVGHTGNFEAAVMAVKTLDAVLSDVVPVALDMEYACVITADHGNVETMRDKDGNPMTNHTLSPVPLAIACGGGKASAIPPLKSGKLADIAPTILKLLGIAIPAEMTGRVLWE